MECTYIDHMGSDDRVVDAARVSFSKEARGYTKDANARLILYLAKHGHFTPFTHCMITMREKVPLFVARQRFKHTVGFSYNETSRRYVDDTPEFYFPDVWRSRPEGSVKQGSGGENESSDRWKYFYLHFVGKAEGLYQEMIDYGVAPEQARMILPQSMYTEYYVTGSLAAWARAYCLRTEKTAQKEIQEVAQQWKEIIEPLFPVSWKALTEPPQ